MTDHADTIRRLEEAAKAAESLDRDHGWYQESEIRYLPPTWLTDIRFIALASPERILALLAERQQAIDERDALRIDYENVVSDRTLADAMIEALQREKQQAIDALRWIYEHGDGVSSDQARAALLSLGEQ